MNALSIPTETSATAPAAQESLRQYLSFTVENGEYAVEILRVQEIKGLGPVTPLPNTPPGVRGVINLRGIIVPILDLRVCLGLTPSEASVRSVVIVLSVHGRTMGVIVDAVSDVLSLPDSALQPVPTLSTRSSTPLIRGLARVGEKLVILLDVERVTALDDAS
jgi:purine-binding chemotaxis protein CheW